mmetsp:Transcript_65325/g.120364  ORF Transcript_65325/g.120364 Transcript_65325/m.120364 type:complete len:400 (-) Transcript_65325:215-1414(-)
MQAVQSFGRFAGTMYTGAGTLGYIKQDMGTEVLVTTAQCAGVGGQLPPVGTRLTFDVVLDPTMAMLRADNVQLEAAAATLPGYGAFVVGQPQAALVQSQTAAGSPAGGLASQLAHSLAAFMPAAPAATPAAAGLALQPAPAASALALQQPALQPALQPAPAARGFSAARKSGVFSQAKESFGFIKQDSGEPDMFVIPRECAAFGLAFPTPGTRVVFELTTSEKTGKAMAQNCRPAFAGTMSQIKNNYGFIKQDNGEPDMFVIPQGCPYFDTNLPPIGMRVVFELGVSERTGKPTANDVQPMFKDQAAAVGPGVNPALMAAQMNPALAAAFGLTALQDLANGAAPQEPSGTAPALEDAPAAEPSATEPATSVTAATESADVEPEAKRQRLNESFPVHPPD